MNDADKRAFAKARKLIPKTHVIVPRKPTKTMLAAAYYAGHVGDAGGAERETFETEWEAVIEQLDTGKKPTGLLELVRPYGGSRW